MGLGWKHHVELWSDVISHAGLGRISSPSFEVSVLGRSSVDIIHALIWSDPLKPMRMLVPADLVTTRGAFAVAGGWHPFDDALRNGADSLASFYAMFRPTTLAEMYFLPADGLAGGDMPPWSTPWINMARSEKPVGEKGLDPEHGVQSCGPASVNKVLVEMERLRSACASIQSTGYRPDVFGDIAGYFLRDGESYRFFVRGAKHRAAILAHLGFTHIPVVFRRGWPRALNLSDSAAWQSVRSGRIDHRLAQKVFARYFEFDGRQQYERIFGRRTEAAPAGRSVGAL